MGESQLKWPRSTQIEGVVWTNCQDPGDEECQGIGHDSWTYIPFTERGDTSMGQISKF